MQGVNRNLIRHGVYAVPPSPKGKARSSLREPKKRFRSFAATRIGKKIDNAHFVVILRFVRKKRKEGGTLPRLLTNPIPKESHGKLHRHAICCKTNGWNMGSLREVSSALQARRREHAGDRATNFGENVSFRCSRAPTTTYGGPPPSRREARETSSLYILQNATQRCHFVISRKEEASCLFFLLCHKTAAFFRQHRFHLP